MKTFITIPNIVLSIFIVLGHGGLTFADESKENRLTDFQWVSVDSSSDMKERVKQLADQVKLQSWPRSDLTRTAPKIEKGLLPCPERVTSETISHRSVSFQDGLWGWLSCSWDRWVKNPNPLPAELPEGNPMRIPPVIQNDPEKIKEYKQKRLERYRKSKMNIRSGAISMDLFVAPCARAAQEWMIYKMSINSLPVEALKGYAKDLKTGDLGTVSFIRKSTVWFVRDNICVRIHGEGEWAEGILPLARKIDTLIVNQPALSYRELLARRPQVSIASLSDDVKSSESQCVSYTISSVSPIKNVHSTVNGRDGGGVQGKKDCVALPNVKGNVKVRVEVVNDELLANFDEKEFLLN